MYKILAALLPFIKELFFDRKEEMDFSSYRFNIKKWIMYAAFLACLVALISATGRLFSLTGKYIDLNRRFHKLETIEKNDLDTIAALKDKTADLEENVKELKSKCVKEDTVPIRPKLVPRLNVK